MLNVLFWSTKHTELIQNYYSNVNVLCFKFLNGLLQEKNIYVTPKTLKYVEYVIFNELFQFFW